MALLRSRILTFAQLFAGCIRLVAISTVYHEEQHLWCSVTVLSGSGHWCRRATSSYPCMLICSCLRAILYGIVSVVSWPSPSRITASPPCSPLHSPSCINHRLRMLAPGMARVVRCIRISHIHGPETDTHYTCMVECARRPQWHCALGPGPVALQISSERTDTGASLKTEVCVLDFANAYGVLFAILWALFLAPV